MPLIHLTTFIAAPVERVFDLARSIDLHKFSMKHFGEVPVDGKMSGLIEANETVTWKAKHLFKTRMLKIRIVELKRPYLFIDEQVKGDFKLLKHEHHFKPGDNGTIMIDQFYYEAPYGGLGKVFSNIYLGRYMKKLLVERNDLIKKAAETSQWKHFLNEH